MNTYYVAGPCQRRPPIYRPVPKLSQHRENIRALSPRYSRIGDDLRQQALFDAQTYHAEAVRAVAAAPWPPMTPSGRTIMPPAPTTTSPAPSFAPSDWAARSKRLSIQANEN